MNDAERLRDALAEVEVAARSLRWADRRPWRVATHVGWSGDLPEVDLHDLDARHARQAVRIAAGVALEVGAVRFVTGRGRHTVGPGGVLVHVVAGELRKVAAGRPWVVRPAGPARWVLITDPAKAPTSASGALGPGFWLLMIALGAAALVAIAHAAGWI